MKMFEFKSFNFVLGKTLVMNDINNCYHILEYFASFTLMLMDVNFSNRVIMNRNRVKMQFHQIYLPFFTFNLGTHFISGYLKLSETSFNSDIATFICAMW